MRRWHIVSAVIASVSLVAVFGTMLLSRGQAQEAKEPGKQTASRIAGSRIDKVTVYPNSALITREVEVPAGAGLIELIVSPMPDRIVASTMYSEAGDGLRVLTTR